MHDPSARIDFAWDYRACLMLFEILKILKGAELARRFSKSPLSGGAGVEPLHFISD
jgi:hypothetical protein